MHIVYQITHRSTPDIHRFPKEHQHPFIVEWPCSKSISMINPINWTGYNSPQDMTKLVWLARRMWLLEWNCNRTFDFMNRRTPKLTNSQCLSSAFFKSFPSLKITRTNTLLGWESLCTQAVQWTVITNKTYPTVFTIPLWFPIIFICLKKPFPRNIIMIVIGDYGVEFYANSNSIHKVILIVRLWRWWCQRNTHLAYCPNTTCVNISRSNYHIQRWKNQASL